MWIIFKNSSRQLLRNKLFSFLNILGLTIGISACWIIYKYVSYELSFEHNMPNKENTYRLFTKFQTEDQTSYNSGISRPIYFTMREDFKELKTSVAVFQSYTQAVIVPAYDQVAQKREDLNFTQQGVIQTDSAYFEMLPYTWLAGHKETALKNPNDVILTEKKAKLYFPNLKPADIIGKPLIYIFNQQDSLQVQVTGVVASLPYNSEFIGEEFYKLQATQADNQLNQWTNTNGTDMVYFQTKDPQTAKAFHEKLEKIVDDKWQQFSKEKNPSYTYNRKIEMMPLTDSHFSTYLNDFRHDKISKTVLYSLVGIAIFLIVLACINYMNLTTAQLPQRSKEIAVRKTLGSSEKQLILQILTETSLIILISVLLSIFVSRLGIALLGDLISSKALAYVNPFAFTIFSIALLFFTLVLSGIYPAWIISKVNAVDLFRNKGQLLLGKQKLNLRKSLIVFQFIVAQLFIISALIVGQQLRYVVHKDMGFNKDAVLTGEIPFSLVNTPNFQQKKLTLIEEIGKIAQVEKMSLGTKPLTNSYSSSAYSYKSTEADEPKVVNVFLKAVDSEYLGLYDFKLIAGQNLLPSDTANSFVINESAVKAFGFTSAEDALGKSIGQAPNLHPIVGVIKDFHQRDFYTLIEPIALSSDLARANTINIKLSASSSEQWPAAVKAIEEKWAAFFPDKSLDLKFYDESIAALYKKEQQLYKLTTISTVIAIIISCLGLFGLATITAFQRSKEIGIRKVLGASVRGIVGMLSKDFVKIVFIALLIASPLVYWACSRWLENFVYRIELSWIPFIIGGGVAVLAALLTVSYQAIRVAKTNPVDSLKDE